MAKVIKRTNKLGEGFDLIRNNMPKYESLWMHLKEHMEDDVERVYILFFDEDEKCLGKENVSVEGSETEGRVELDKDKIEQVFEYLRDDTKITKWGLAHNHPVVIDEDGKWQETFVSDGDILTTKSVKRVAHQVHEEFEYIGHYVVNKEDRYEKIIGIEDKIKFNMNVIDEVRKGNK